MLSEIPVYTFGKAGTLFATKIAPGGTILVAKIVPGGIIFARYNFLRGTPPPPTQQNGSCLNEHIIERWCAPFFEILLKHHTISFQKCCYDAKSVMITISNANRNHSCRV